jgi:hypothetical protein
MFLFDKFNLSEFYIIRIVQKFVFYISLLAICAYLTVFLLEYFDLLADAMESTNAEKIEQVTSSKEISDNKKYFSATKEDDNYHFVINKELVDKTLQGLKYLGEKSMENIIPNVGAGTAAAYVGSAAVKYSSSLPPAQRAALGVVAAGTTGVATKVGLELSRDVADGLREFIKNSEHANTDINRIPSPGPSYDNMLNSTLEELDLSLPFVNILFSMFKFGITELILLLLLAWLICYKYIFKFNMQFTINLINKYVPEKYRWISKYFKANSEHSDKGFNFLIGFFILLLVIAQVYLLLCQAIVIYNFDSFVQLYIKAVNH